MTVPDIVLSNGVKVPILGFGTWQSAPGEVKTALRIALEVGYRHIDTATVYGNEEEIGRVLKEFFDAGKLKREEVFITTKVWKNAIRDGEIEKALRASLKRLQLEYVDLYLIHMPTAFTPDDSAPDHSTTVVDSWKGMESVYAKKLTRAIGVSNFRPDQIERIQQVAKVPIHNLQVELHLVFPQFELQKLAQKHNISLTAYAPIGSPGRFNSTIPGVNWSEAPEPLKNPKVLSLAEKHHKSPAQILLRHLIQRNIIVIPKSTNEKRIKENFALFDFNLSDAEVAELNNVGVNTRLFKFEFMTGHPEDLLRDERKQ